METQFSGLRAPIESQYGVARENILGTMPEGGGLNEALTGVETARAQGLSDLATNLYMDQLSKMYGAVFGAPQQSMAGLGSAAQSYAQRQGAQLQANQMPWQIAGNLMSPFAAGLAGGRTSPTSVGYGTCCFNFLEAEGDIYWPVRLYRDEHYPKSGPIGRGYLLTAKYLVPIMAHYKYFKILVRITMTRPLKCYSQWYYGENPWGLILWPLKALWTGLWRLIGMGVR